MIPIEEYIRNHDSHGKNDLNALKAVQSGMAHLLVVTRDDSSDDTGRDVEWFVSSNELRCRGTVGMLFIQRVRTVSTEVA